MRTLPKNSRGIALLTTLLLVSIGSTVAVSLVKRQWVDIRKTQNTQRVEQSWLYAQGVEAWALARLRKDIETNEVDSAHDEWNHPIAPTQVEGGELSASIKDLQGRFNINNLLASDETGKSQQERFRRLLRVLDQSEDLINPLLDWLDKDSEVHYPTGAEDSRYSTKKVPYRPANQPMTDISELYLVEGFDDEVIKSLAPYLVALPGTLPININTAKVPVLMSVAKNLSEQDAQSIVDARAEEPFADAESFLQHPALSGLEVTFNGLAVSSDYFMVSSKVQVDHLKHRYQSLLVRTDKGDVRVIQRVQKGVWDE